MADMLVATLRALLTLDPTGYIDGLSESENAATRFAGNLSKIGGAVVGGVVAAAGAALAGGVVLAKGAIEEAMAAEEILSQLDATLANTGATTGVTTDMVTGLADSLSSLTRFEDDTVVAGGEVLARFKEINSDIFPQTLELSLDLAQRLGTDVPNAATLLGKALAEPGEGLRKLKEAGVVFSDEQEKMIDQMVKAGDVAGAQALILGVVNEAVGGAAQAAGNTAAGMWDRLRNIWGNVLETIGTGLLPVITALGQSLVNDLSKPEVQAFVANLAQGIADFAVQVYTYIPTVIQWFKNIFGFLQENEGIVIGILAALGVAALAWGISTAIAAATAMAPLLPVIGVVLAIAAVVYLLYEAWTNNWGGIRDTVMEVWANLQPAFDRIREWLSVAIPAAIQFLSNLWTNTLLPALEAVWSFIQANVIPLLTALGDVIREALMLAFTALAGILQNVILPALSKLGSWMQEKVMPVVQDLAEWLGEKLAPAFRWVGDAIQGVIRFLTTLASKLASVKLPEWMTPGSPTPWEIGLLGVAEAFAQLNRAQLPAFAAQLNLQQPAFASGSLMTQPVSAATAAAPVQTGPSDQALLEDLRNLVKDLPAIIARSNRVAFEKVVVGRSQ